MSSLLGLTDLADLADKKRISSDKRKTRRKQGKRGKKEKKRSQLTYSQKRGLWQPASAQKMRCLREIKLSEVHLTLSGYTFRKGPQNK